MKKIVLQFTVILTVAFLLQGCVKDSVEKTYSYFEPVLKSKTEVWQNIKTSPATTLKQTGKLYLYNQYIFVNEINKGVHIIDNSNPNAPRNIAFIDIPGNVDVAVKDNILYADLSTDLISIDIQNPLHVVLKKVTTGVFPYKSNGGDTSKYIVDWVKKTTTDRRMIDSLTSYNENVLYANPLASSGGIKSIGVGGSMARFTIVNHALYTVDQSTLTSFNITVPAEPVVANTQLLGWNIETIYPLNDKLFIGSQTGMFIYDLADPFSPVFTGNFSHACFQDPVIADGQHAFVTLRATESGSPCWGMPGDQRNQLDVIDISNLQQPTLVKIYDMAGPTGLSKDGNYLFICDGNAGVKIFDASNVHNLSLTNSIAIDNPFDVICQNGNAIIVAKQGIYQYDYSNINNVRLISQITIQR